MLPEEAVPSKVTSRSQDSLTHETFLIPETSQVLLEKPQTIAGRDEPAQTGFFKGSVQSAERGDERSVGDRFRRVGPIEINEQTAVIRIEQHVPQGEISMDNPNLMQFCQRSSKFGKNLATLDQRGIR
jgi:hypothetical protein